MQEELSVLLFKKMLLIRKFEECLGQLASDRKISGVVHLSIGQEAVAAGTCAALKAEDWVVSGHRAHGHAIAKGVSLPNLMAEILGKETGCCKGRGGSMHIIDMRSRVISTSFVGSGFPIASGLGLSSKIEDKKNIALVFAGDGATNTGAFHESLNLCAIWKLPVVFVIENNLFAISTQISSSSASSHISDRAKPYGITSLTIDGNDVVMVYDTLVNLVKSARSGLGPSLVECLTYRLHGHYEGEQWEVYRKSDEVQAWEQKEPILRMKQRLLQQGVSETDIQHFQKEAQDEVNDALSFAERSESPNVSQLSQNIFA